MPPPPPIYMSWLKRKKQEVLEDPWRCVICQCKDGYLRDGSKNMFAARSKRYKGDLCIHCACDVDKERERRIKFMRNVVGSVVNSRSPYRDGFSDPASAWDVAKALANTDPYRDKDCDPYITL